MLYTEQAARCAVRLTRTMDPQRRALIEREHLDWLDLAKQRRSWIERPIPARTPA